MKFASLLIVLLLPGICSAAPSFDCAKAKSPSEKLICSADSQRLASLDNRLNQVYRKFIKSTKKRKKVYLKNSQKAWLAYREKVCFSGKNTNIHSSRYCLENLYETRINELENEVIIYNIIPEILPLSVSSPDAGIVKFKAQKSKEFDDKSQTTTKRTSYSAKMGKLQIPLGVSESRITKNSEESDVINSIKLGYHSTLGVFFSVSYEHYSGVAAAGYNWGSSKSIVFIIKVNNEFKPIEPIRFGSAGSRGHSASMSKNKVRWLMNEKGQLSIAVFNTAYPSHAVYIGRTRVNLFSFNTKKGFIEQKNDYVYKNLEKYTEKVNAKYKTLYSRLLNKVGDVQIRGCSTNIRLDKARFKIYFYLAELSKEQLSWSQLLYAASKLADRSSDYVIPDDLLLLGKELLRYKKAIEGTPNWKEKLGKIRYGYYSEFTKLGFPDLDSSCINQDVSGSTKNYFIGGNSLSEWLYGFWYRRYRDKSYMMVSQVIEALISQHDKLPKDDNS